MKRSRSKDKCYLWVSQYKIQPSTCLISKVEETKIWHEKLCHLNFNSMRKIIFEYAIMGFPKLKIEEGKICGDFQIGKHTKMSHKKLHHFSTTNVLDLLHMDLIGHMQDLARVL